MSLNFFQKSLKDFYVWSKTIRDYFFQNWKRKNCVLCYSFFSNWDLDTFSTSNGYQRQSFVTYIYIVVEKWPEIVLRWPNLKVVSFLSTRSMYAKGQLSSKGQFSQKTNEKFLPKYTEVRFASYLSGGFTTMAVINLPERNLAKRTSVHCFIFNLSK